MTRKVDAGGAEEGHRLRRVQVHLTPRGKEDSTPRPHGVRGRDSVWCGKCIERVGNMSSTKARGAHTEARRRPGKSRAETAQFLAHSLNHVRRPNFDSMWRERPACRTR